MSTATHDPSKRSFMRLAGTGAVAMAVGGVIAPISRPDAPEPACDRKSVTAEVAIIQTTVLAVKPLWPSKAALLDKISALAGDFGKFYARGDLSSAHAFVLSLAENISTLIADAGKESPRVQFLVATIGGIIRALAALFLESPAAIASMASPAEADKVRAMGSPAAARKVLDSVRF